MIGDSDTGLRLEAELGFTYWVNQASGVRLAAQFAEDAGAFYLGARLEATYGLLDGVFARHPRLSKPYGESDLRRVLEVVTRRASDA